MSVCGIVAEYNPFHNGHLYQIKKAKEITLAEHILVVMSGNFIQRGEPAIIDKFLRTKMALSNGADIVLELPVYFSTASAKYFATAAVNILDKSSICDYICFGSESNDIDALNYIADIMLNESQVFKDTLKHELSQGLSFPLARANALSTVLKDKNISTEIISEPNDILSLEYIQALTKIGSNIKPFAIKRISSHYHSKDVDNSISSATGIRNTLLDINNPFNSKKEVLQNTMPQNCFETFQINSDSFTNNNSLDKYSQIVQYLLRTKKSNYIKEILDVNEGLENRLLNYAGSELLISELIAKVKTKRYTYTKLQRAIMHLILDIRTDDFNNFIINGGSQYIRVLGFNTKKEYLLKELVRNSKLPVIINLSDKNNNLTSLAKSMLDKEIVCTDIYNMFNNKSKLNQEYFSKVVKI